MPDQPPAPSQNEPPSPCVQICSLDEKGVCIGCGRTIQEITLWPVLDAGQKRAVLEAAKRRMPDPA